MRHTHVSRVLIADRLNMATWDVRSGSCAKSVVVTGIPHNYFFVFWACGEMHDPGEMPDGGVL